MTQEQLQECIDECLRCMQACNYCYKSCLGEESVDMMKDCIRLDRECADICAFTAQALTQHSTFSTELCRLCADACERCGNECSKHHHSAHCQKCAEACFRCAEVCRKMIA